MSEFIALPNAAYSEILLNSVTSSLFAGSVKFAVFNSQIVIVLASSEFAFANDGARAESLLRSTLPTWIRRVFRS